MNPLIGDAAPGIFQGLLMLIFVLPAIVLGAALALAPLFIWAWTKKNALNTERSVKISGEILAQLKTLNRNIELLVNQNRPPQPDDYPVPVPGPVLIVDEEKK